MSGVYRNFAPREREMRTTETSIGSSAHGHAPVPTTLVASIVGASLVLVSALFFVWLRMTEVQSGYEVYRLQRDKVRLRQERSALEVEIAALRRPDRLQKMASQFGLIPPSAARILTPRAGGVR